MLTTRRFHSLSRGFDLYHEPNFIPLRSDLPTIITVHDLSVLLHPEWHPADRVHDWERRFREGLRQAAHVLTVSDHVRREIIHHLGIPPERVTRTYNGSRPHFRPLPGEEVQARLRQLGLPPRYLLHVGTIEPRKNLLMLMRAYCDLPASVRESCPLVLVGGWGWNSADVRQFLDAEGKRCGVIHPGYVAEADLPAVYNGARALVFPTRYEGFGMPTVEMFACGGAVIASTAGAVAEVVAGHGHLIDPDDLEGWRDAMRRVITDDGWRSTLTRGGVELAAAFTWEASAAGTMAAYRAAAGVRHRRAA
jgi:alpha-1,3-rhamnosyl/mannosyltransferase